MDVETEDIVAALRQNCSADDLLPILLLPGASGKVAQDVRANGASQDTISLLERCFQALRKGIASGGAVAGEHPDAAEHVMRRLEKVTGTLCRAAVEATGGEGDEKLLAAYPSLLLDQLDTLTFAQLAALLSDICRGVEGGGAGTVRLLRLLPKAAALLVSRGAPDDEAEEEAPAAEEVAAAAPARHRAPPNPAARHVDTALHRLTQAEWVSETANFAVQIMEALRDVPMTPQQLHSVLLKALSVCSCCSDLAALPAMLRQLMRLAGLGHRGMVLRGVLGLFDRLEAQHRAPDGRGPSQVLQNVEGTALVILADAFKYDSALAQELVKAVRGSAVSPSPFCLLLLFTLSRQQKLDTVIINLIKGLVVSAFEWDATRNRSAWLASLPQLPRPGGQQLRNSLLRAVRCSGVGGEVVVPGILSLGAALMGCCPASEALALVQQNDRALLAATAEAEAEAAARRAQRRQQQHGQQQMPPRPPQPLPQNARAGLPPPTTSAATPPPGAGCSAALQSALLGIQLLQAAFEAHKEARPDVLRLCQQALGGTAGGGGSTTAAAAAGGAGGCGLGGAGQELALPAVLLLGNLVARHPSLLYEYTTKLKDTLQSFLLLPAPVALGLLLALWPLARVRRELCDFLVMLLRKVMFAREAATRLVAVRGFLFILLQQLRAAAGAGAAEDEEQLVAAAAAAAAAAGPSFSQASCSQSSLSQMQALTSGVGVSLQHELQGFLRRALGQQASVRAALYDGLSAILLADPGSRDVVLELVAPQLQRYVVEGATMPPLRCKLLVSSAGGGSDVVVLAEPLPSLLACVRRLVALCRDLGPGPEGDERPPELGILAEEDPEGDVVMVDNEDDDPGHGQGTDAAVKGLVHSWDSLARRLVRCEAEHFELDSAADLNPATASGAAKQLQAGCLLGAIEVAVEELVGIATGPHGSETAALTGDKLVQAFELHCRLFDLAREAKASGSGRARQAATEAAAGSGGDGSGGTAAQGTAPPGGGAAAGGGGATAGSKRPRDLCPDLVPADARPPALSAACLGKLCSGVMKDGLAAAAVEAPDAGPSAHTRLVRSPVFQAFVMRSCLNSLRAGSAATSDALSDSFVDFAQRRHARQAAREQSNGAAGGASRGGQAGQSMAAVFAGSAAEGGQAGGRDALGAAWKPLARPLVLLCQTVLSTWSGATKRPVAPRKAGGAAAGGPAAAAAAAAARREATAADSLAGLAVSCLHDLLGAAAGLGGLAGVAWVLQGLPIHSQDTQAQVDETDLPYEDLVAARLPHFSDMLSRLMTTGSYKEAAALVEVVVAVARLLPPDIQGAVSDACLELMHQDEPKVTHPGLVRALVAAHVTLRGTGDQEALLQVAAHIQEVIGATGKETQPADHAPRSLHDGTAQQAAMEVLRLVQGAMAEGHELLDAVVRGAGGGAAEEAALAGAGGTSGGYGGAAAGPSGRNAGAAAEVAGSGAGTAAGPARPNAASNRSLAALVEALCRRLVAVVDVLQTVVQTRLGNPQVLEYQVEVLIKTYRLLALLAKAHVPAKGAAAAGAPAAPPLSRPFHELVSLVHRELTPPVYTAMNEAEGGGGGGQEGGEEAAGAVKLSRAKLKRDARAYSQLVHAMEDWEKHLLALDKAFKAQNVNLMKGAKRSANRDFQLTGGARGGAGGARAAEDRTERRRQRAAGDGE